MPIIPSHGILVAIGIAAHNGVWSVPSTLIGTTTGSFLGALGVYMISHAFGEKNSKSLLYWIGKRIGLSHRRLHRTVAFFRIREQTLTIASQLVPTARLISPAAGYLLALTVPEINSSMLALIVLVLLIVTETLVAIAWRLQRHLSRQLVSGCNK